MITGAGGDVLLGRRPHRASAATPHDLASMRHVGDVASRCTACPQPTIAKVRGVAVGAGLQHRARLRPRRRQRQRPLLGDLRPPRAVDRLRWSLAAAPAHRAAPGQGAGAARRHHRRRRGRADRPGQPGGARRPSSTGSSPTGPPGSPPARRSRSASPSGCSTTRSRSRSSRRSTTRRGAVGELRDQGHGRGDGGVPPEARAPVPGPLRAAPEGSRYRSRWGTP